MDKEEYQFQKRIDELANRSYSQCRYVYTDFLNMAELSQFYEMSGALSFVDFKVYGGHEEAERCMVGFGSEKLCGYEEDFPIACVKIMPRMQKFADRLNHRDFLGALMSLGVTREKLGDIIIKENEGYLFCQDTVGQYIVENLTSVKHTPVACSVIDSRLELPRQEMAEKRIIVSGNRADAIIAKTYKLSREQALNLFREKRVFIGGRCTTGNSQPLKAGDVVSVRGYGKFLCDEEAGNTQKGRLNIMIREYC
jgi:RNA-binding protein YlmH